MIQPLAVAGPEQARLPELTSTLFEARGDGRQVGTVPASLQAFGDGTMLAPAWAELRGRIWRSGSRLLSEAASAHFPMDLSSLRSPPRPNRTRLK